jgi:hypothetical protein
VMIFAICGVPFNEGIRHAREVLAQWQLPTLRGSRRTAMVAAEAQRVRSRLYKSIAELMHPGSLNA